LADPDFVAAGLEGDGVGFVGEKVVELLEGLVPLAEFEEQFGVLHPGSGVGMAFKDQLPNGAGALLFPLAGQDFGESHEGVAVVVLGVGEGDFFEEGAGFVEFSLPQQALAEAGLEIGILRVTFDCGAVGSLGLGKFSLLEVNPGELGVVVRFVEVVDGGLQFFDPLAVEGAREFKTAGEPGAGALVNQKEIENGVEQGENDEHDDPEPLLPTPGVHKHPNLESGGNEHPRVLEEHPRAQPVRPNETQCRREHWGQVNQAARRCEPKQEGEACRAGQLLRWIGQFPRGCPGGAL
jgi:hypothetical protein